MRRALVVASIAAAVLAVVLAVREHQPRTSVAAANSTTEVVVTLAAPPLARTGPSGARREDAEQRSFSRVLARRLPEARVRWRYRLVLNGFSVVLPSDRVDGLRSLPGVRNVYAPVQYGPQASTGTHPLQAARARPPAEIGAPAIWGPNLANAGQGVKIGIIDTGLDQRHPYFDPTGYTMPPGFPKGQVKYTTAKVIVAQAFPPPGATSQYARLPFDPTSSEHGTHVAGIAAGDANTRAEGGVVVSGIAPRAYIGNYKALTATSSGLSPNGNSPELVAAIEAAVRDGMTVVNLSIGENEAEPSRDVVAQALDAAAAAGVVPVVAAGNDYQDVGAGSVSSPGSSAQAITVGAVEDGDTSTLVHADFSSVGPSPMSLRLKPDVAAPGVDVLSSIPGGWATISGTSMAAPHVAGAAALLLQRHPGWTPADVKAALVETGNNALATSGSSALAGPPFVGGGVVWLPAADDPRVLADPADVSWGLVQRGADVTGAITLSDAGDGAGMWTVSLARLDAPDGVTVTVPAAVTVPGPLAYEVRVSSKAAQGDISGYVVLRNGAVIRRVPFWAHVEVPRLQLDPSSVLARPGLHAASTLGRPALVSTYRYPADPEGVNVTRVLAGPEVVFRIRISRPVANFGVVVTYRAPGVRIEPRAVVGLDENRLTGWAGLPVNENPYLDSFDDPVPAAGALLPSPGWYAVVFDSPTRGGAGRFAFRFWVNDVTPPTVLLRTASVRRGSPLLVSATDAGSGVYPASIVASVDGAVVDRTFRDGLVRISTASLALGRHRLRIRVSDYQEAKNDENVPRILPNTRTLTTTFTVRS